MTTSPTMTYHQMAVRASDCSAAALVAVLVRGEGEAETDFIFPMTAEEGEETDSIDFPCVMIR